MLSNDCLVQVSGVEVYMEGATWPPGIGEGRYPLGWSTGAMTPRVTILSRVFSIWSWYSVDTFHWACWTGGKDGSVWILYVFGMCPIMLKERG